MSDAPLLFASRVVGKRGVGQDRVYAEVTAERTVLLLADGAGGIGGGGHAADLCVRLLSEQLHTRDPIPALISSVDKALLRDSAAGETTVVAATIAGGSLVGVSVGDSGAWLLSPSGLEDLTSAQSHRPMLGTGEARPHAFTSELGSRVLLIASDGLLKYAQVATIEAIVATEPDLERAADRLVETVRLRSGALQDDISLILVRTAH